MINNLFANTSGCVFKRKRLFSPPQQEKPFVLSIIFRDVGCIRSKTRFYVFPDGTYLYGYNGNETIYGEFYIIENGVMRKVANDGQKMGLPFV